MMVNGFDFDAALADAEAHADAMIENGLYSRFGAGYRTRVQNALVGRIGELAFEQWLLSSDVTFEVDTAGYENRNSDEFDFRVHGRTIDVKVAKKSTLVNPKSDWCFGVPVDQFPEKKDVVVVGWVDFQNKQVHFHGWMSGKDVANHAITDTNSFSGKSYLTDNHELTWGELNQNLNALLKP